MRPATDDNNGTLLHILLLLIRIIIIIVWIRIIIVWIRIIIMILSHIIIKIIIICGLLPPAAQL